MENRYLFKAKRIDNREWVQGYLYGIWEKRYILWGMTNDIPDMIEVDPSTICQCTGLKDKNGKLIWENDVVDFLGHKGTVVFERGGFGIGYQKILIGKRYKPILCVLQGVKTFYMLVKTIIIYHCGKSIGILMMRMIR